VGPSTQYLRLTLQRASFLLPSAASLAIEQRDALALENGPAPLAAWRSSRQGRWPAYCLDAKLKPARRADWQRAVFVAASAANGAVGLAVDEVQLLTRTDLHVLPFTPLGAPPTRFGHLFSAAWVEGADVTLVLDPTVLGAYLHGLGGAA
jgi:hypothetical protein